MTFQAWTTNDIEYKMISVFSLASLAFLIIARIHHQCHFTIVSLRYKFSCWSESTKIEYDYIGRRATMSSQIGSFGMYRRKWYNEPIIYFVGRTHFLQQKKTFSLLPAHHGVVPKLFTLNSRYPKISIE